MMNYFVHDNGICESKNIGDDTKIWAFAHVLQNAIVGKNCNICDHVFIENDVVIGDNVTIKCGVQIWDGVTVENNVFIGPNVTFTNDPFPRSKVYPTAFSKTVIRERSSIGANSTILPGIEIGHNAMVGAGAVVTKSVPANAIVIGNPAKIIGYVNDEDKRSEVWKEVESGENGSKVIDTRISGVKVFVFPEIKDLRGNLTVGDFNKEIPFEPKRYFMVYDVPSEKTRGAHAHKKCKQFLICVGGCCSVVADDGINRKEFLLDSPNLGIYLPEGVWGIQYKYSHDAILIVFASEYYDSSDYIRDYNEFLEYKGIHK